MDAYIGSFPEPIRGMLRSLRIAVKTEAPDADETINYGIPTFTLHGNLVHFAAYKHHIGFYPTPSAIRHFSGELTTYTTSKGAVQFPLDRPLPLPLIRKMVAFRVREVLGRVKRTPADKPKSTR